MRIKKYFVLISALFLSILNACENVQDKESNIVITNENITSEDSSSEISIVNNGKKSYGKFAFGIDSNLENVIEDNTGIISFEYYGEEIRIPYYVENMDESVNAQFGLLAFTNGYAQEYRIEDAQGNILYNTSYMQKFNLNLDEKEEFYLVFTPVSGEEGENISFITATILNPEYITETNNYGIYYSMSATIPQQIVMKQSVENKITSYTDVEKEDISNEVIEQLESTLSGEDTTEILSNTFACELKPVDNDINNIAYINNDKVHLKVLCYGGPEALYYMNLFINNEPTDMNECNIITFYTEKSKMISAEIEIDVSSLSLKEYNTIYAVFAPGKQDYKVIEINASEPLLLRKR